MVHLQHRAWQILARCEKLLGSRPYHEKTRRLAAIIYIPLIVVSCTITLVIRLLREWKVNNIEIVLEDALLMLAHFIMMLKFSVSMIYKPRREIFEKVETQIETIVKHDEAAILNIHSNKALTSIIRYAAFVGVTFSIYDMCPVAEMFFYYYRGNGTLEKKLPFAVDYLVDEQEYFYYILAHLSMVVIVCVIIEISFDLGFILFVRHLCAIFEIVKLRLKAASNIFHLHDENKKMSDSDEEVAFEIITSAVDLHIEAMKLCESVDNIYRKCWFVGLIANMSGLAPLPIMVIIYWHYPLELFRRSLVVVSVLAHFYLIFSQGQMIINHSSSVFDTCRDFHWYKSSKRCRVAISIIMVQSVKPCRLTGVLFYLSMETYCNMLKTALSYISMFTALDITIQR